MMEDSVPDEGMGQGESGVGLGYTSDMAGLGLC
jgi:hypothetical protein